MPKPDLEGAYALKTTDDARRLYAGWAETYDSDFAAANDFVLPGVVARAFAARGGTGPVLDFGCGTGLAGVGLAAQGISPVDGADLSPEMLAIAGAKGAYRSLIEGDVLAGYDPPHGLYAGLVSSGTFTHGHVGPDALGKLLPLTAPGALFVLSINTQHYHDAGFADAFAALKPAITEVELITERNYGPKATGSHKDDTCQLAIFHKR